MSKLARLKPTNKKRNFFMRRYMVKEKCFMAGKWYKVDDHLAEFLAGVHSRPDQHWAPDSVLCFDIVNNSSEARELERRERKAAMSRASAHRPHNMTSREGAHEEVDLYENDQDENLDDISHPADEEVARRNRMLAADKKIENSRKVEKKTEAAKDDDAPLTSEEEATVQASLDEGDPEEGLSDDDDDDDDDPFNDELD